MIDALIAPALVVTALAPVAGSDCHRFEHLHRLPASFEQITAAEGVGWESFVLTDHVCTCANDPAVARAQHKPVPDGLFWSCRPADHDERQKD